MLIKVENLSKIINGKEIFIKKSLSVNQNEVIGLIGKNGSGKSMFLKTILGIKELSSGEINFKENLRYDYYLNDNVLYFDYSVYDNICIYSLLKNGKTDKLKINQLLTKFHLNKERKKKVSHLSKGQKQRLALLISLINYQDLDVLILDEPFSNFDAEFKKEIIDFIFSLDCAKIICSHELENIETFFTDIVLFEGEGV